MPPATDPIAELSAPLARAVARRTEGAIEAATAIPGLNFYRRETPTESCACVVEPCVALVVQGAKRMSLGHDHYHYDPSRFLVTSLDLPATMQVLSASPERPYLGLALRLDLRVMSELLLHARAGLARDDVATERGMVVGQTTPALFDAFTRLLALLDEPASIPVLAPMIQREIYWRVLTSEQGARLRQIVSVGSQGHRVAHAIEWLKTHYAEPLRVEALAERSQMSLSTFHHHFRQLTAMSPIQFQKWLRLTAARHSMLAEDLDAATAAYRVGYESASQFSREYARLFGAPPRRDVETLRQQAGPPPAVMRRPSTSPAPSQP
nr:AraC family transcriptional regulator [Derxia lacustris]